MEWYGSVQNRISERCRQPEPEVGMGVTAMYWSDREPYEIVAVKDARHITVRRMGYKCRDYYAGEWDVFPDPNGRTIDLFKTKKGQWRERIGKNGLGDLIYVVGYASKYEDPTF